MPEREGVAGVEAAVGELVHRVQRERPERVELADAGEMEEAVAADLPGDVPEEHAEHRARTEDPPAAGNELAARRAAAGEERRDPDREQQRQRQRQRAADEERDRERSEDRDQRPSERGRGRAHAERAGDRPAGGEHDRCREREPEQGHRPGPRARSCGGGSRAEPRGPVAVHPAALAAEERAAEQQRRPQEPPRPLRAARSAMLGEEAQVPAQVLAEEPAAVRGAADVHALGAREEEDLPAGLPEPVAPVGLLAEEEEVLVERADRVDRLPADEHAGAHHDLRLEHAVVGEAAGVERVQELRSRSQLAQEEVLRREPPGSREPAHRALQRPVRVREPRADDRGLRVLVRERHEPFERALGQPGVGVQDQDVAAGRDRETRVPARRKPSVLPLEDARGREELADDVGRPVGGAVVDDDRLLVPHAREALLDPRQRVVA